MEQRKQHVYFYARHIFRRLFSNRILKSKYFPINAKIFLIFCRKRKKIMMELKKSSIPFHFHTLYFKINTLMAIVSKFLWKSQNNWRQSGVQHFWRKFSIRIVVFAFHLNENIHSLLHTIEHTVSDGENEASEKKMTTTKINNKIYTIYMCNVYNKYIWELLLWLDITIRVIHGKKQHGRPICIQNGREQEWDGSMEHIRRHAYMHAHTDTHIQAIRHGKSAQLAVVRVYACVCVHGG